ncbi:hypothetical protein KR215_007480 [Drosophila sulfurigaster]|nr:hypothetical protein KR215_007480 [Drosophila sulfurigaster]
MMQGVGQRSCVQHRLDQRSRVHNRHNSWSGMDNGSVDNGSRVNSNSRSSMNNGSRVNSNGRSSMNCGLQDGSNNMLDDWLAVHLGDALVRHGRRSAVHHGAHLGENGLMHHMVGFDEASRGGGNQESDDSNLQMKR